MAKNATVDSTRAKTRATKGRALKTKAKTRAQQSPATKVMGMTIPKTLRNALDSLVNSPRGREILASAIVAAATAAAAALVESSNRAEAAKARGAASEAGDRITRDLSEAAAGVVAGVIGEAARSLLPAVADAGAKTKRRE
jgi:hypothetical protein